MAVQIIRNDKGEPQYAVVPDSEYEKLINAKNDWEDVPYTASKSDDVTVPNAIVKIMIDQEVSLLAAWRVYRDLSQYDVAENSAQPNPPFHNGRHQAVLRSVPVKN